MEEASLALVAPGLAYDLEQRAGADDVRAHKGPRRRDAAIDMRLRSEMDDGVEGVLGEELLDEGPIADVAMDEDEARVPLDRSEVLALSGVGQRVENDEPFDGARIPESIRRGCPRRSGCR